MVYRWMNAFRNGCCAQDTDTTYHIQFQNQNLLCVVQLVALLAMYVVNAFINIHTKNLQNNSPQLIKL